MEGSSTASLKPEHLLLTEAFLIITERGGGDIVEQIQIVGKQLMYNILFNEYCNIALTANLSHLCIGNPEIKKYVWTVNHLPAISKIDKFLPYRKFFRFNLLRGRLRRKFNVI